MYCIYEDNVFTNLWIGLPIRLRLVILPKNQASRLS